MKVNKLCLVTIVTYSVGVGDLFDLVIFFIMRFMVKMHTVVPHTVAKLAKWLQLIPT